MSYRRDSRVSAAIVIGLSAFVSLTLVRTGVSHAQRAPVNSGPRQGAPVRRAPRPPGGIVAPTPSRAAPQTPASAARGAAADPAAPLPPGGGRGKIGQNISGLSG